MSCEDSGARTMETEAVDAEEVAMPEEGDTEEIAAETAEDATDDEIGDEPGEHEREEVETPAAEADTLQFQLDQARAETAANYDRYLRAVAELDNFRKRTAKIRTETRDDTLREMLLRIAPVLDNMTRALGQESSDAQTLRQGIKLIHGQLMDVLEAYGLRAIEAVGQPFDPNLHEAMMEVESDDHPPGTVVEETEKGYTLNKKTIRPARVIVSRSQQ